MIDVLAAMALLVLALLPLAYSLASEKRLARAYYQRAIAMEIVDGEIEVLAAGHWRDFPAGTSLYQSRAAAATNLPPGELRLSIAEGTVQLEWLPAVKHHGPAVTRKVRVQ